MMELFKGQEEFLEDYKKVAKNYGSDKEIVDAVMDQLNEQQMKDQEDLQFVLSAEQTTADKAIIFPFTKELYSEDQEATISTRFCYAGTEYRPEIETDEQP